MERSCSVRRTACSAAAAMALATYPASGIAAQQCEAVSKARAAAVAGAYALGELTVILLQHDQWWTTPGTGFHLSAHASASKSQDELLHAAVSYHAARLGTLAWRWACVRPTAAAWLGAVLGIAVALPKEIGDGFHEDQGFSLADAGWSVAGAILPALQRTVPPAQALLLKGNYWPSTEFLDRSGREPRLLTDYAGQRYFLAFDPGLLRGGAGDWPDWLGLAVGHSVPQWIAAPPVHQWYLTLDLNLRGLPIRAPWWRSVAAVLDQIKWPMPGVRLMEGELRFGLY